MALEMTYNLGGDLPITAYVRIKQVTVRHDIVKAVELGGTKWVASISLEVKSAKDKNTLDTWAKPWEFAPSMLNGADDLIKQAYTYLKTLPEFSTVTDRND
jgi:hypothetical protein